MDNLSYLRIGDPVENSQVAGLETCRMKGTNVYQRKFTNGEVLVNIDDKPFSVKPDGTFYDPETKQELNVLFMNAQTSKILLKKNQTNQTNE